MLTLRAFRPILAFTFVCLLVPTAITAKKKPPTATARAGPTAQLILSLTEIGYPAWGPFGVQVDTPLVLQNPYPVEVPYTATAVVTAGPASWLGHSFGTSGTLPAYPDHLDGFIYLNQGGVVVDYGTGMVQLVHGFIRFDFDYESGLTDDIPIEFYVGDTLFVPVWDTLSTGCLSLTVSTNGNMGNSGRGKVNMDYWSIDCDTLPEIPGLTEYYLYDGSPVIGWFDESSGDTVVNFSFLSDDFLSENGLRQVEPHTPVTDMGTYYEFHSGVFATNDTSLALEKTWYAPKNGCFVIQCLKVYLWDINRCENLVVGEVLDWDIPSDSGVENTCGYDASRNLIYQVGAEYDQDDNECLDNSQRCGGIALLEWFYKDYVFPGPTGDTLYFYTALATAYDGGLTELQAHVDDAAAWYSANVTTSTDAYTLSGTDFVGASAMDLEQWFTPEGGLPPGDLYDHMNTGHITEQYLCFADSAVDLFTVMTFKKDVTLSGEGCCVGIRGNANYDPEDKVNITDVSYLLNYMFGIPHGPAPPCTEEANANGDSQDKVSVSDVSYLLTYLFGIPTGPAPPPCPK
ncbi:MAG: hypothetical protein OEW00_09380 [candidate division Zixibacteria bacterium]|nr:hypothetical protein [candidate division Zixibacteria bacterium]